jgi:VIT1/CCC1 family predicted Fe2+/Mn2+ transporter
MAVRDNSTAAETTNAAATTYSDSKSALPVSDSSGQSGKVVAIDPGNVADSGKKIIYTVNISLQADDANKAITDISNKAIELGGYISNSSYSQGDNSATGSVTVRISPEKLKELTEHIGTIGTVLSSNMGSQDVTAQYVDITARLENAQAQEAQLLAIMAKAVEIKDILSVRTELDTIQSEIEELKGEIRLMDNQVGYSTVIISVTQPTPPPVTPEADKNSGLIARWSFNYILQNVQKGFANSMSFTVNTLGVIFIVLSYLLIPAVIIGGVTVIIVFIVKRSKKKKISASKPEDLNEPKQ